MELYSYIIILGVFVCIAGIIYAIKKEQFSTFILFIIVGILCVGYMGTHRPDGHLITDKVDYIYQVRELEKNTVFNIKDSIGGYSPKDTVWINMDKLVIDPRDSVAMQAVIIKQIK